MSLHRTEETMVRTKMENNTFSSLLLGTQFLFPESV